MATQNEGRPQAGDTRRGTLRFAQLGCLKHWKSSERPAGLQGAAPEEARVRQIASRAGAIAHNLAAQTRAQAEAALDPDERASLRNEARMLSLFSRDLLAGGAR